jgi:hypothetical protein
MSVKSTTRCGIKSWARAVSSAIGAILLAVLIIQMAVPLRVGAADVANESEEFTEDGEPTEESEPDGEQTLFEAAGVQAVRTRQPGVRLVSPDATAVGRPRARGLACLIIATEMQRRNGIGGPLRC